MQRTSPTAGAFSLEQGTTLNTPGGIPACTASCTSTVNSCLQPHIKNCYRFEHYEKQILKKTAELTSASARAERGVSSAGFTTTVQPTAMAAPTFLVIIALGKFHCEWGKWVSDCQRCKPIIGNKSHLLQLLTGVIIEATPTGCLRSSILRSLAAGATMSP